MTVFAPEVPSLDVTAIIGEYVPPWSDVRVTFSPDSVNGEKIINTGTRFLISEPVVVTGTTVPGEVLTLTAQLPALQVATLWRVVIEHQDDGTAWWQPGVDALFAVQAGEAGPINLAARLGSGLAPTAQANVPTWPGLMQVFVRSVNGVQSDSTGNVNVTIPDGATIETVTINPLPSGSTPTGSMNGTELRLALPESQDRAITADITTGAIGSTPSVVVTSDSTTVDLSFEIPPPAAGGSGGIIGVTGEVLVTALGSTPTVTVAEPSTGVMHLAIQVPVSGAVLGAGGLTRIEKITDPAAATRTDTLYAVV